MQEQKDKWEIALDEHLSVIKECQQKQNVDSCLKCEHTFNCEIRDKYVKAVYESMNKGSGGGFEF